MKITNEKGIAMLRKIRNGAPIVAAGLIVLAVEKIRERWPMMIAGICIGVVLMFGQGCVYTKSCPSQDVYMGVMTPFGPLPFMLPQGYLDDPDNFFTEEQMQELSRQRQEQPAAEEPEKKKGI